MKEKFCKELEGTRGFGCRYAGRKFVEKPSEPMKTALESLVKIEGTWLTSKKVGMKIDYFNELRTRAQISVMVQYFLSTQYSYIYLRSEWIGGHVIV